MENFVNFLQIKSIDMLCTYLVQLSKLAETIYYLLRVQIFSEGHEILKKSPNLFDI